LTPQQSESHIIELTRLKKEHERLEARSGQRRIDITMGKIAEHVVDNNNVSV